MALDFPVITKVIVPQESKIIDAFQSIVMAIEIRNGAKPKDRALLNPSGEAFITIHDPDDTNVVSDGLMEKVRDGVWGFRYTPDDNNALGYYTATFSVVHAGGSARLENIGVFFLRSIGSLVNFDYFCIKDQNDNTWYWWINRAVELDIDDTVPSVQLKAANDITPTTIPSWIEIVNASGATRYLHPGLDGNPIPATSQPTNGSGIVGSPQFTGVDGGEYTLGLNIVDELVINSA